MTVTAKVFKNGADFEYLENRLALETLVADLSSRFINLPSGGVDREIEDGVLRVLGPPRRPGSRPESHRTVRAGW